MSQSTQSEASLTHAQLTALRRLSSTPQTPRGMGVKNETLKVLVSLGLARCYGRRGGASPQTPDSYCRLYSLPL